jgi:hypothetical protein
MIASARQRSIKYRVPHLPKPVANPLSCDHEPTTARLASGPVCSLLQKQKNRLGEEAATPGQPAARACAHFWIFPRQFTLENHRLPLALPQSFGNVRKPHVSMQVSFRRRIGSRNTKTNRRCEETVEDETSLWKNEEN